MKILPTFYNCLSFSDKTYCLPSLGYLGSPYKPVYPKATKQKIKMSYFEQWDNSCWSLARSISPASQALNGLFLQTNSMSLKMDKIQTVASLLGWRDGCTTSTVYLHLHLLKPITMLPRTATRIPPESAKVRVCWKGPENTQSWDLGNSLGWHSCSPHFFLYIKQLSLWYADCLTLLQSERYRD